jgi:ribose transport system ATP-binding protein
MANTCSVRHLFEISAVDQLPDSVCTRQGPNLLLLDEPTKGVDIGAKGEIHRIIRRLAEGNDEVVIVVVSSEEEEILAVADDVVVFRVGTCDGTIYDPAILGVRDGSLRSLAWHQEEMGKRD